MALASEEGREKLRKATGNRKWFRSVDVRMGKPDQSYVWSPERELTRGIETS